MREEESAYWDTQAKGKVGNNMIDNIWKRAAILSRIFQIDWYKHKILEIGTGNGIVGACIKSIFLGHVDYTGTDVSGIYCGTAKKFFGLTVKQADILDLPNVVGRGFTRVIALDSLEHVRPEDREQGFRNIGDIIADNAIMIINMPMNESYHNKNFDHAFSFADISWLGELARMEVASFEIYKVNVPGGIAQYGWSILKRGTG